MNNCKGFQMLRLILYKKRNMLTTHIFHIISSLCCLVPDEMMAINSEAFEQLIGNLSLWKYAAPDVQRSIFEQLIVSISNPCTKDSLLPVLCGIDMLRRIFYFIRTLPGGLSDEVQSSIGTFIFEYLLRLDSTSEYTKFAHFLMATLPIHKTATSSVQRAPLLTNVLEPESSIVSLRNYFLDTILFHARSFNQRSSSFIDEFLKVVGFDWMMAFMLPDTNRTTVYKIIDLFDALFSRGAVVQKFCDKAYCGSWMSAITTLEAEDADVFNPDKKPINFDLSYTEHSYAYLLECICSLDRHLIDIIPKLAKCVGIRLAVSSPEKFAGVTIASDQDRSKVAIELFPMLVYLTSITFFDGHVPANSIRMLDDLRSIFANDIIRSEQIAADILIILVGILISLESIEEGAESHNSSSVESESQPASEEAVEVFRSSVINFIRDMLINHIRTKIKRQLNNSIQLISSLVREAQLPYRTMTRLITDIYRSVLLYLSGESFISSKRDIESCGRSTYTFLELVIDKLWRGEYIDNGCEVFDVVLKMIQRAMSFQYPTILPDYYKLLNRVILFVLSSYSNEEKEDNSATVDILYRLAENKTTILSEMNTDTQFVLCLVYCLFQCCSVEFIPVSSIVRTSADSSSVWHMENIRKRTVVPVQQQSIIRIARRIWLYICDAKRALIEDALRTSGNPHTTIEQFSDILQAKEYLRPVCLNSWMMYIDSERRQQDTPNSKSRKTPSITQQISRAIRHRIYLFRGSQKRIESNEGGTEEILSMQKNLRTAKDLWEAKMRRFREMGALDRLHQDKKWKSMLSELVRERAVWGPDHTHPLTRWMLDDTEGFSRMRRRLKRNEQFFKTYKPVQLERSNDLDSYNIKFAGERLRQPSSWIVNVYEHCLNNDVDADASLGNLGVAEILRLTGSSQNLEPSTGASECTNQMKVESDQLSHLQNWLSTRSSNIDDNSSTEAVFGSNPESDIYGEIPSNMDETMIAASVDCFRLDQRLAHLVNSNEKILQVYPCKRVCGLSAVEGLFFLGQTNYYVVDGYEYRDGELINTMLVPNETDDAANNTSEDVPRVCEKYSYENVTDVLRRRYLLQPLGIEIFSRNGRNLLLAFSKSDRETVYSRLFSMCASQMDKGTDSISGQRRNVSIEQGSNLLNVLFGSEKTVMQRWEKGEITNFEYIMYLNTIAGRSYNDLVQYPIFPWIIADYDSEVLDLSKRETYRDLQKPMGAQCQARFEQYQIRAEEINSTATSNEIKETRRGYHYNTHYSSAMIVAWYMMRLEPFTSTLLSLQGGNFDLADRAFYSIKESWLSASEKNMSDVKELIPEFFYLPEFLVNTNKFNFGVKQCGDVVDDVILPPWAKNDPREFIRIHRMALESDYVSANLNHWIDLIFGYKQRGSEAFKAGNLFHPQFYEGNVDFDSITDETLRLSTIGFINNFGQIPKQIFRRPHVQKKLSRSLLDSPVSSNNVYYFNVLEFLTKSISPIIECQYPISWIGFNDKNVLVALPFGRTIVPSSNRIVDWSYVDSSLRIYTADTEKLVYSTPTMLTSQVLCCCCCCNGKLLVFGCVDSLASVWSVSKIRSQWPTLVANLIGHQAAVTAIAASDQYRLIYTGSADKTVLIWDMNQLTLLRQLQTHSSSIDAICVHALTGDFVTSSGPNIYYWSINGDLLASVEVSQNVRARPLRMNTLTLSQVAEWDDENVVIAGDSSGFVTLWRVQFTQVPIPASTKEESSPEPVGNFSKTVLEMKDGSSDSSVSDMQAGSASTPPSQKEAPVQQPSVDEDFVIISEAEVSNAEQWSRSFSAAHPEIDLNNVVRKWRLNRVKSKQTPLQPGFCWSRRFILAGIFRLESAENLMTSSTQKSFPSDRPKTFSSYGKGFEQSSACDGGTSCLLDCWKTGVTAVTSSRDHKSFYAADSRGRVFQFTYPNDLPSVLQRT